jgi:nucleoside-diphosphate-sugar epimerase
MKYTITGGADHISKPLAEKLLAAGHSVTVIGRSVKQRPRGQRQQLLLVQ